MQTETTLPTLEAAKRAVVEASAAETAAYIRRVQSGAQADADFDAHLRAEQAHARARQQLDALLDPVSAQPPARTLIVDPAADLASAIDDAILDEAANITIERLGLKPATDIPGPEFRQQAAE